MANHKTHHSDEETTQDLDSDSFSHDPPRHLADLEAQPQEDADIVLTKTKTEVSLGKRLADAHDNKLSQSKVIIVLLSMSLSLATAFIDVNGLSIVLPYIANDLDAHLTISWANTSQLISMTIFQLLCGRFADIFGRKNFMVTSILILGLFQMACALSKNQVQFFVFRAICGMADGNIQSLSMTVMSDIVPLEKRGEYQGYITAAIGLGNGVGPFLASLFIQHSSWRKYFYTLFSMSIFSSIIIGWLVPNSQSDVSWKQKLLNIDYIGFFFGAISIVLILIPINGGGLQFAWDSPKVISMFAVGGVCFAIFLVIELKFTKLPLVPVKLLFGHSVSLCMIFLQCIFFGMAFFSLFFYYGYYFEVVRGLTPIKTACFFLCIVIPHSLTSAIAGRLLSRFGHYNRIIQLGFLCWTTALSLLAGVVNRKTSLIGVAFIMILNGIGQGMTFQTTMVAALAHTRQQERAVIISSRQVLRFFGGGIGMALSTLIFAKTFTGYLGSDSFINLAENATLKTYLRAHVYSKIELSNGDWSDEQVLYIRGLYMKCLRWVYTFWAPLIGACLVFSLFVKDRGLVYKADKGRDKREKEEAREKLELELLDRSK